MSSCMIKVRYGILHTFSIVLFQPAVASRERYGTTLIDFSSFPPRMDSANKILKKKRSP